MEKHIDRLNPPPLSSSSSASTRSSAHTSNGSAPPYSDFVHVADVDDDSHGFSPAALVRMLATDPAQSSSARPLPRSPDPSRSSQAYSVRSRSSSLAAHDAPASPPLSQKPSYDISWQTVDERDEIAPSEDETDDEQPLEAQDPHLDPRFNERTSAAVIADEGRGLIVQADNVPIVQLHIQPGTTHLLLGSSATPNAIPSFLASVLPQIAHNLLALDISANFLVALPPVLAVCHSLEELNVASNPLRVLPVFLADLLNLRLLIADSTGLGTLPDALVDLDNLHTISIRRNKLHALPSWLCLLPALHTLCLDGNPFQGPWKALVDPLLAKVHSAPYYPPSTPMLPHPDTETDDDYSDHEVSSPGFLLSPHDEDHTITPAHGPFLSRSTTSPLPVPVDSPTSSSPQSKPKPTLARTRTTPNRAYFDQSRISPPSVDTRAHRQPEIPPSTGEHEVRKMKSAGDLRRGRSATTVADESEMPRPKYQTSQSSTNLLNGDSSAAARRFAGLGPNTPFGSLGRPPPNASRPLLSRSMWDSSNSPPKDDTFTRASSHIPAPKEVPKRRRSRDKSTRWGFLKKMSMGKIKPESPSISSSPTSSPNAPRISGRTVSKRGSPNGNRRSTVDAIEHLPASPPLPSPNLHSRTNNLLSPTASSTNVNLLSPTAASTNFLGLPGTSPRAKRRSFLPVDAPGAMSLSIPENSAFVTDVVVSHEGEDQVDPVPVHEQYIRREEDRARDAYMRALRSVMAYLKDMNDLGTVQQQQPNPLSVYGQAQDDLPPVRSRRPTMVDSQREVSMASSGSTILTISDTSAHLRSSETISGIRSGTSSQTLSVATTDSTGSSSEERKFKDDKGKRAMVIREIVLTERTYVKGLQELVDIYIKPASTPVNLLSGVGSSKDTVVPAPERRVVFGGIDALFSFHNDSFLPALEGAAAPLLQSGAGMQDADIDGQVSHNVAKVVGDIFVKHAAFMRMYSSYINNFDSSVQRVKYWTSDRNSPGSASPGSALSPSSSSAQLVGMGLNMANANAETSPAATGIPNLTTSQRKRIKTYLKRCRLNPRHTQLNLEGYLLLPVQRVPRYKLLLEELLRSTPPTYEYLDDPLDRALAEIALLANNMNEGKRDAESRRKLVQWQTRIRGKFPSPLVQPHRRLIMDGKLLLTRVVRKAVVSFEAINGQGDTSTVQVDCLAPELTPRPLVGILCNDLLVLCRDPSDGLDPGSPVDLWAVLRMQTLPQPASIVHGNSLRLVDNKAILYFDAPGPSDALNWYRAINLHIPASKT